MINTLQTLLHETHKVLCTTYSSPEAYSIAWELITFVMQHPKQTLFTNNISVSDEQIAQINNLVHAHIIDQVPIAYLTQRIPFGELSLAIKAPILIPRPETEEWCYRLITLLKPLDDKPLRILDLCTGSGCIALALAQAFPHTFVVGVDILPEALTLAKENMKKNNIKNCAWIESDLFDALNDQQFDIIVSNPPYISHSEWLTLDRSVRDFESPRALVAPDEGYALIQKIIRVAPSYIRENNIIQQLKIPQLFIEIGHNQAEKVEALMHAHAYVNIGLWEDYNGHTRVVCGSVPYATNVKNTH